VHFLESNGLPLKFRVSDYLVQSELKVLQKCVHISVMAWILIAAAVNVCYYLMGIIMNATGSQHVVGTTLTWIFIGGCISFVPISYAMYEKCSWIYAEIMKKELIDWSDNDDDDSPHHHNDTSSDSDSIDIEAPPPRPSLSRSLSQSVRHYIHMPRTKSSRSSSLRSKALRQLDLFWAGDPSLIVFAFQFMQLGYAIAASTLLIFWEYIDMSYSSVGAKGFILSLALCYLVFLYVMAQLIPRYTLCTSLGQLVNHRRVNETLAQYKLDEALRKKHRLHSAECINKALSRDSLNTAASATTSNHSVQDPDLWETPSTCTNGGIPLSAAPLSPTNPEPLPAPSKVLRRGSSIESNDSEKMTQLAEMVHTRTTDLPSLKPSVKKASRRSRKKAHSDGVALMANLKDPDETASMPPIELQRGIARTAAVATSTGRFNTVGPPAPALRSGRYGPRVKSVSANVALMQSPASSMYAMPSISDSIVSEGNEEEESEPALPILLEDIPARSVDPSELVVPVGRRTAKETSTSSKIVRVIEMQLENEESSNGNDASKESENTTSTSTSISEGQVVSYGPKPIQMLNGKEQYSSARETYSPLHAAAIKFLSSRIYRLISGVFGTMLVFFVIGMRIEAFLIETRVMPDNENTWHLRELSASFWWILAWFSTFVAISSASSVLFFLDCKKNDSLHLLYASIFDVFLSAACLGILIMSETQRCCETGTDYCAKFGTRTFGGLGSTEPFIALIAMRVFRYQLGRYARRIAKKSSTHKSADGSKVDAMTKSTRAHQIDIIEENTGTHVRSTDEHGTSSHSSHFDNPHHKAKYHFAEETGTAVELWKNAVGLFPSIVEEHGEFSEELLRAMLGIAPD